MRFVVSHGGNALRLWIFTEPSRLLLRGQDGKVNGLRGSVITVAQAVLELAAHYGVYIVLVLFNGATVRRSEDCALFAEDSQLNALTFFAIRALAAALRGYESLAMWEVVNEPEGVLDKNVDSTSDCTDIHAAAVRCPGDANPSGWNNDCRVSVLQLQRFVNRVAAALKAADPNHLVTVGSWSFCMSSALRGGTRAMNVWSSTCLLDAGGMPSGTVDVWQMHTYPKDADGLRFHPGSPVFTAASDYGLDGPIIIGEWSNRWVERPQGGLGRPTAALSMAHLSSNAVRRGFAGSFSWSYTCMTRSDGGCVTREVLAEGLEAAAVAAGKLSATHVLPEYSRISDTLQCERCSVNGKSCSREILPRLPHRACRVAPSMPPLPPMVPWPIFPPAPVPVMPPSPKRTLHPPPVPLAPSSALPIPSRPTILISPAASAAAPLTTWSLSLELPSTWSILEASSHSSRAPPNLALPQAADSLVGVDFQHHDAALSSHSHRAALLPWTAIAALAFIATICVASWLAWASENFKWLEALAKFYGHGQVRIAQRDDDSDDNEDDDNVDGRAMPLKPRCAPTYLE